MPYTQNSALLTLFLKLFLNYTVFNSSQITIGTEHFLYGYQ